VRLEWVQELDVACTDMEIVDSGGFDTATVEMWGPTPEGLVRIDMTAPDGAVERLIVEQEGVLGQPIRWWSSPGRFGDASVFRQVDCQEGSSTYAISGPPMAPNAHGQYIAAPKMLDGREVRMIEAIGDIGGAGTVSQATHLGRPVTVVVSTTSGTDELGAVSARVETWLEVELNTAERTIYENRSDLLGVIASSLTVVECSTVPGDAVSFSTDDLYLGFERDPNAEVVEPSKETTVTTASQIEVALAILSEDGGLTWNLSKYESAAEQCADVYVVGRGTEGSLGHCSPTSFLLPVSLAPGTGGLNLGADGFQYVAYGQAGSDIVSVRLMLHDGSQETVPVQNGLFGYASDEGFGEGFVYLFEGLYEEANAIVVVDLRPLPGDPYIEHDLPGIEQWRPMSDDEISGLVGPVDFVSGSAFEIASSVVPDIGQIGLCFIQEEDAVGTGVGALGCLYQASSTTGAGGATCSGTDEGLESLLDFSIQAGSSCTEPAHLIAIIGLEPRVEQAVMMFADGSDLIVVPMNGIAHFGWLGNSGVVDIELIGASAAQRDQLATDHFMLPSSLAQQGHC